MKYEMFPFSYGYQMPVNPYTAAAGASQPAAAQPNQAAAQPAAGAQANNPNPNMRMNAQVNISCFQVLYRQKYSQKNILSVID